MAKADRRRARLTALPDDAEERGADLLDSARDWTLHEAFLLEELLAETGLTATLGEDGRLVIHCPSREERRRAG